MHALIRLGQAWNHLRRLSLLESLQMFLKALQGDTARQQSTWLPVSSISLTQALCRLQASQAGPVCNQLGIWVTATVTLCPPLSRIPCPDSHVPGKERAGGGGEGLDGLGRNIPGSQCPVSASPRHLVRMRVPREKPATVSLAF